MQPATPTREPGRARRRVRRVLTVVLVGCLTLVVVGAGVGLYLRHRIASKIDRVPGVFAGLEDRPPRSEGDALNILVLGTDLPSGPTTTDPGWLAGTQDAATILVVHLDGDRRAGSAVSIPRDTRVPVPGHGTTRIDAAFSGTDPSLAVATVEGLSGVRIDHLAVIDWAAFGDLVDLVGGTTVADPVAGDLHLDGAGALQYVRDGHGATRVPREQDVLRELMEDALHAEMRHSPRQVYRVLSTLAGGLALEEEWSVDDLTWLLWSLRDLRTADIAYLTMPADAAAADALWAAVRDDDVAGWVAQGDEVLAAPAP